MNRNSAVLTRPTVPVVRPAVNVSELGEALVLDGLTTHSTTLSALADWARLSNVVPAAAAVLVDDAASDVARFRAFSVVSAAFVRIA